MPVSASTSSSAQARVVARARAGDGEAFALLVASHRHGVHLHCYRMLGSLQDAEDLVQETMVRAWRGLDGFEERASFRGWLYRIATNACLDALKHRRRRMLPDASAPPDDPSASPRPAADLPWLEPYPDTLLNAQEQADPARSYETREAIELAFITAIQCLPPRQRAVLLLRDALGFSARETAEMLEVSLGAANSALHRARALVAKLSADRRTTAGDHAALVARYVSAWEAADVEALVALLREDARMTMPPTPSWYLGRAAIARFLAEFFAAEPGAGTTLVPTGANRQPALVVLARRTGGHEPLAVKVLTVESGAVTAITGFADPRLFSYFVLDRPVAAVAGVSTSDNPR
jgi:RNA polymerase sigma-70 factor, ECF subfamily